MNDNSEYQSELFDEFSRNTVKQRRLAKPPQRHKQVTLIISREKLIFSVISVILLYVIFFSLGIERGKKIAFRSINQNIDFESQAAKTSGAAVERPQPVTEKQKAVNTENNISNLEVAAQVTETEEAVGELKEFYSIQAAAYSNLSRAEKEARRARSGGNEAVIDSSGKYHLLLIGKFKSEKDAAILKKKLTNTYKGCYIRKYKIEE